MKDKNVSHVMKIKFLCFAISGYFPFYFYGGLKVALISLLIYFVLAGIRILNVFYRILVCFSEGKSASLLINASNAVGAK